MDVANTADSDRPSGKARTAAVSNEAVTREPVALAPKAARKLGAPEAPVSRAERPPASARSRSGTSAGSRPARVRCSKCSTCCSASRRPTSRSLSSERRAPAKDVLAHALHEQSARARRARSSSSTAAPWRRTSPRASFSGTSAAPSPARSPPMRAPSSVRTAGRSFSTRSGSSPSTCNPAFCAPSRAGRCGRVGGKTERRIDVRVIAASNRDLRADVSTRKVSRGPLLPTRRRGHLGAAAARAARGLAGARSSLLDDLGRGDLPRRRCDARRAAGAPLARQRPRAEERARLRGGVRRPGCHGARAPPPEAACDPGTTRSRGSTGSRSGDRRSRE